MEIPSVAKIGTVLLSHCHKDNQCGDKTIQKSKVKNRQLEVGDVNNYGHPDEPVPLLSDCQFKKKHSITCNLYLDFIHSIFVSKIWDDFNALR